MKKIMYSAIMAIFTVLCMSACSEKNNTATLHIINSSSKKWNISIQAEGLNTSFRLYGNDERKCVVSPGPYYIKAEKDNTSLYNIGLEQQIGEIKKGQTVVFELTY